MCEYNNKCSGHGKCLPTGLCKCDDGYGLSDCSVQAKLFEQFGTYTLKPREYAFFKFRVQEADAFLTFDGENGILEAHYSTSSAGPVTYSDQAVSSLMASKNNTNVSRSLYMSYANNEYGYLTV
mmetsp:Transcript_19729/g.16891  ORF Transcript_19729/g.16891 Transcript_19729/m.16891 type:complete len:124 (-) Transcript_19729:362-733(-)